MLRFLLRCQPYFLIGELTEKIFPKFVARSLHFIEIKAAFRLNLNLLSFLLLLDCSRLLLRYQFFTARKLHVELIRVIGPKTTINHKFRLVNWSK